MSLPIGTRVRVKAIAPEDAVVAAHIAPHLGKVGTVKTLPESDGSIWVEFSQDDGGVFYPAELETLPADESRSRRN